jgi:hypothetical protein
MTIITFFRNAVLTAVVASFSAFPVHAELIPSSRLVDWTPGVTVGVPGGIDQYISSRTALIDVTQAPYYADNTGATDTRAAIQAAINAATSGMVVYLPAGRYRLERGLNIGPNKSGITLRGAGHSTVIDNRNTATAIFVGSNSDYRWAWPKSDNVVTAGLTKGSTQITIGSTSAFSVGQMVRIRIGDDEDLPVLSVMGYTNLRKQFTRITAKTATTLSVFPPIYADYGQGAVVNVAQQQGNHIGIEDLFIDSTNATGTYTIWMEQCYGSWIKNVKSRRARNFHILVYDSLNCEVRQCYLDEITNTGSNGAGLLVNTVSGSLFEDNIIYKAFPLIEVNHGSSGNVFAYNFLEDSRPGVAIDSNHGPHNAYNLYEGNISPNLQADGYYGSASDDTIFRNWLHGRQADATKGAWVLSLNRFTRNYSVVGNLFGHPDHERTKDGTSFGNPNMGNGNYTGFAPPWTDGLQIGLGTLSQDAQTVTVSQPMFTSSQVGWFVRTPSDGGLATITKYLNPQQVVVTTSRIVVGLDYVLTPGPPGYQGLDLGVEETLVRKGNYSVHINAVPSAESVAPGALPASLFRAAKPSWWGILPWPAFDPASPNMNNAAIPAGYRYVYGTDAPQETHSIIQPPINVRVR